MESKYIERATKAKGFIRKFLKFLKNLYTKTHISFVKQGLNIKSLCSRGWFRWVEASSQQAAPLLPLPACQSPTPQAARTGTPHYHHRPQHYHHRPPQATTVPPQATPTTTGHSTTTTRHMPPHFHNRPQYSIIIPPKPQHYRHRPQHYHSLPPMGKTSRRMWDLFD